MDKLNTLVVRRGTTGFVSNLRQVVLGCLETNGKQRRFTVLLLCTGLALLLPAVFSHAQQISKDELSFYTQSYTPPISSSSGQNGNLVEAIVVVRDAKGGAVAGLNQGDFKIYDNGKQQTITQFAVMNAPPGATTITGAPPAAAVKASSSAAPATAEPRYIALFFDDLSTPFKDFSNAQLAAEKFIREQVHSGDEVGVFTASNTHTLDFTDDTAKLLETIQSMRVVPYAWPQAPGCAGSAARQYPMGPYAAYLVADKGDQQALNFYSCSVGAGTFGQPGASGSGLSQPPSGSNSPTTFAINPTASASQAGLKIIAQGIVSTWQQMTDALLRSLEGVTGRLAQERGERIVVLTSAGFFSSTLRPSLDQVASDALRNRVVINSLNAKAAFSPEGNSASDASDPLADSSSNPYQDQILRQQRIQLSEGMNQLAVDTGGRFFQNRNDLALGLQELAAVPQVSYRLGFVPANLKDDGHLHHLKFEVTAPGNFEVRARQGYYAPTKAAEKGNAKADQLNQQVLETDEIQGILVQVGAEAGRFPTGGTGIAVSVHVDAKSLAFKKAHGRHQDTLNMIVALLSPSGTFVTGETGIVDMNLKNDTLANLESRGINPRIVLKAGEGDYRLRVVMVDLGSGKTFATTRSINIP